MRCVPGIPDAASSSVGVTKARACADSFESYDRGSGLTGPNERHGHVRMFSSLQKTRMPRSSQRQTHSTALQPVRPPPTSGFGEMVKQGVALGTGQAVAHAAIGSLVRMISSSPALPPSCSEYQRCLTKVDQQTCDTLFEQCAPASK